MVHAAHSVVVLETGPVGVHEPQAGHALGRTHLGLARPNARVRLCRPPNFVQAHGERGPVRHLVPRLLALDHVPGRHQRH